jgi:hypothetical protein
MSVCCGRYLATVAVYRVIAKQRVYAPQYKISEDPNLSVMRSVETHRMCCFLIIYSWPRSREIRQFLFPATDIWGCVLCVITKWVLHEISRLFVCACVHGSKNTVQHMIRNQYFVLMWWFRMQSACESVGCIPKDKSAVLCLVLTSNCQSIHFLNSLL